jgi:hypothetical protein
MDSGYLPCSRTVLNCRFVRIHLLGTGPFPNVVVPFGFSEWSLLVSVLLRPEPRTLCHLAVIQLNDARAAPLDAGGFLLPSPLS